MVCRGWLGYVRVLLDTGLSSVVLCVSTTLSWDGRLCSGWVHPAPRWCGAWTPPLALLSLQV